jgi:hypothetical protein
LHQMAPKTPLRSVCVRLRPKSGGRIRLLNYPQNRGKMAVRTTRSENYAATSWLLRRYQHAGRRLASYLGQASTIPTSARPAAFYHLLKKDQAQLGPQRYLLEV